MHQSNELLASRNRTRHYRTAISEPLLREQYLEPIVVISRALALLIIDVVTRSAASPALKIRMRDLRRDLKVTRKQRRPQLAQVARDGR